MLGIDGGRAAVHELQLAYQFVAADALQQIAGRADPQRLEEVLLVVVDRQHHDLAVRLPLAQRLAQVQAAGALHAHVGQHDVGVEVVDHAERPLSTDGLADHLHPVGEGSEHRLETLDDHFVVVYQDDSHWSGGERAVGRHGNTLGPALVGVPQLGLANPPNGGG